MDLSKAYQGSFGTLYYVKDMSKSVQYYKDIFNLKPKCESPEWSEFDFNGHSLCLHAAAKDMKIDGKGILIVKVKNLREVVGTLKSRGVEFVHDVHEVCENGFSADFKDLSGNLLSLFEYIG